MKKFLSLLLCAVLLTGCGSNTITEVTAETHAPTEPVSVETEPFVAPEYATRFDTVTEIVLSDEGIMVDGGSETDAVYTSHDIIYYENRDSYDSGNPYGEGTDANKHTAEEAAAHTVVNITQPGAYRVTGKLSAGQIRVDLGDNAYENPEATVELILENTDITCTVAPAILFLNTYECDGNWSADSAKSDVDTTAAGANLILEGENTISGSYVAKIFKDTDGEKKLWKQDAAIYSYMSMNVFGPGSLDLTATNEGMGTELHLTVNGGTIRIFSDNDGINTNEDGVSVTTINAGSLTIFAGLGVEGDGVDSNGYLVINGGSVVSAANPASDAGLDSDLGSFINGGTVIAFGSTMDWAESDSKQVTMNLQFAQQQAAGSKLTITQEDGTEIFSFESDTEYDRPFSGLILSHPAFAQGETYHVYIDGVQMAYTGTDVGRSGPGGRGGRPGTKDRKSQDEEGFDPDKQPEHFDRKRPDRPDVESFPEGERPEHPKGGSERREHSGSPTGESRTEFYMNDMVNSFSGVTAI